MSFQDQEYLNQKLNSLKRSTSHLNSSSVPLNINSRNHFSNNSAFREMNTPSVQQNSSFQSNGLEKNIAVPIRAASIGRFVQSPLIHSFSTENRNHVNVPNINKYFSSADSNSEYGSTYPLRLGKENSQRGAVYDHIKKRIESPSSNKVFQHYDSETRHTLGSSSKETNFRTNLKLPESFDKHEDTLIKELSAKLINHLETNEKLSEEVIKLKENLESEKVKTQQLEEELRIELTETKMSENETLNEFAEMERKLAEVNARLREEDELNVRLRSDMEHFSSENSHLRGEMKRLGDLTAAKIVELENQINNAARMKQYEIESFEMERKYVQNTCDTVIEQLKLKFSQRGEQVEKQMIVLESEKERLLHEGKTYLDILRGFNAHADELIEQEIIKMKKEQGDRNDSQLLEITSKIEFHEDELVNQQRKVQELFSRLQMEERNGKTRILNKKTESVRQKEELATLEQQFNKLLVSLNAEERDNEKKSGQIARLEFEAKDLDSKIRSIETSYEKEMKNIQEAHALDLKDLDGHLSNAISEENDIKNQIIRINEEITNFQKKHQLAIESIQKDLSNTLMNAIPPKNEFDSDISKTKGKPALLSQDNYY